MTEFSGSISVGKADLVVMGELPVGAAEAQFITDLATSITSASVSKAVVDQVTILLQTTMKQIITDMVDQAAQPLIDSGVIKKK